ncbi:MAG: hypothetical protein IIW93_05270 [Bacteroidaceae bacterium]|nr:hypothetical protein [Bacteroidaceae bacterium]
MQRPTRFLQHYASPGNGCPLQVRHHRSLRPRCGPPSEEINLYITHVNDILSEVNSFHNQCLADKKKDAPTFDSTSDPDTDPQEPIQGSEA